MQNTINIGIVTSPEGMELFESVLKEIQHVQPTMLIYQREDDIKEMIDEIQEQVDVIVFSGPVSYYKNRDYVKEHIPTIFVGYSQMELSKGLLLLAGIKGDASFESVSIDTFTRQMAQEVFSEISIPMENIYVKEFKSDEKFSEIAKYHLDLWKSKKINHVITARRQVYLALKEERIPVIRVFPTKFTIRESINKAILMGENSKSLDLQIAVSMFSLIVPERLAKGSDYELEKLKLDFHRILVDIADKMDASLVPSDSFEFTLYTNRGFLNDIKNYLNADFIDQLETTLSSKVCVGLGLGKTMHSAQNHARQALKYATMQGGGCGYLIRDDGGMMGPISKDHALSYVYKSNEPWLNKMSQDANLSIDTVSRILAFGKKYPQFTAEDLAHALHVTPRHVRTIINALVESTYLKQIGDERPYPKGRPRKLYSLAVAEKMNM